ncbi:hypothetical protein GCM10008018_14820 [Paenibacillus marchantiophytorum]|uniref:C1q domain-containing protein n=1 Tax=Paenibacillus marchantiophytorum TaxID=1619310 RepID=A0ABQ2BUF1_9BACL|nr:hypothetical protein [Paenibacillus marchantiophytorum]GGI45976.1 hypothetical protein GCM10008018_14820 [Paenibacillus marchantiophytorum]
MPSSTTNMGLYKKNPSTDGNDTFDINTMLNDNWDRIDSQVGGQLADSAPMAVNLVNGLQVVTAPKGAPFNGINIRGRTLVNLLGRDGNCEDLTPFFRAGTVTLDSTIKKYGTNSFKTAQSVSTSFAYKNNFALVSGRYYVALMDAYMTATSGAVMALSVQQNSLGANIGTSLKTFDSSKLNQWQTLVTSFTGSAATGGVCSVVFGGTSTGTATGYMDGLRLYEVTAIEYGNLTTLTVDQLAAKYPYVDDVKHINAPYVIKYGENLLPTFNEWTVNNGTGGVATITNPYSINLNASGSTGELSTYYEVPVISGQQYTLTNPSTSYMRIVILDITGTSLVRNVISGNTSRVLTMPSNATILRVIATSLISFTDETNTATYVYGTGSAYIFSNPILNLGATAKPFKPRNDDMLAFPNVQLASSVDGTVYDTLFKRDGKYFVEKRFKDMVLDGSLGWITNGVPNATFGRVGLPLSNANLSANNAKMVKFDGKTVSETTDTPYGSGVIDNFYIWSNDTLYIDLANADTGWGNGYPPSVQEIQAYFYGWKMFEWGQPVTGTYNGTGTKGWIQANNVINNPAFYTNVLPTSINTNKYTPYKLTYQLATPTFEEIQVDAGMSLHEGLNQIEVGQGVIVREKVDASFISVGFNQINTLSSPLKYRNSRLLRVYKNGRDDAWFIGSRPVGTATIEQLGYGYAQKIPSAYDPTATYEISYIALDQHLLSAPITGVSGEAASNLKTVVDTLAINQADQDARISANEILARQIYNVPQKTTANMTLYVDATNGADNGDGSAVKPYKTIQFAINQIPQVINHFVTVNVAAGTYAESIIINGFVGQGKLLISSNSGANVSQFYSIINNTIELVLSGFNITTTTGTAISANNSSRVIVSGCAIVSSAPTQIGIQMNTGMMYVVQTVISNRNYAILANLGKLISDLNSGTNNNFSLASTLGGEIVKINSQPSGLESLGTGAAIRSAILNPWGDNTQANRSAFLAYQTGASNQVFSASTITKVNYSQATFYDNKSEFTLATSTFIAKDSGLYLFTANLRINSMPANSNAYMSLYINGTEGFRPNQFGTVASVTSYQIGMTQTVKLNAGDMVNVYFYCSNAVVADASQTVFQTFTGTRIA